MLKTRNILPFMIPARKVIGTDIRQVLDALSDIVIQYDQAGRILWCNQLLSQLMECNVEELIGKTLPELGINNPLFVVGETSRQEAEAALHTAQGIRWFAWSDVEFHNAEGSTDQYSIARDITTRKLREAAYDLARERAEQESHDKSRLLATVSHEIRTPMNGVIGMAGLLGSTPLTPEQRTYLDAIRTSTEALVSIVDDLLDYSRVAAGRLILEPQRVVIRELIEGVIELLAVQAFDRKLGIGCHISPDVSEVIDLDPGRFRQILLNLLGNALKFTSIGGVLLTVESPQHDQIVLTVTDTGPGMDAKTVERLFQDYEQAEDHRTRPHGGTGLGLAITQRLVEAMKGEISVNTSIGMGVEFTVCLPLSGLTEKLGASDTFDGLSVMIITPWAMEGEAFALTVQSRGGEAAVFREVADAISTLEQGRKDYDVLVVDASLEAENSPTLSRLKENGLVIKRALTLISPNDRPHLLRLREDGYNAFIARPPRLTTMVRLLNGELPNSPMQPTVEMEGSEFARIERPLRVLLAEDNKINALLTYNALEKAGCTVTTVSSGLLAIDALTGTESAYEVAIIDINLPEIDGLEVIRRLRAHEKENSLRPLPVQVLSADGQKKTRQLAFEYGATGFAEKPIDPVHLLQLLGSMTGLN